MVVSSDEFNWNEKHKKTYFTYEQRKQLLEAIRYVDLVIPEKSWQQKRSDIHEYHVDTFVILPFLYDCLQPKLTVTLEISCS